MECLHSRNFLQLSGTSVYASLIPKSVQIAISSSHYLAVNPCSAWGNSLELVCFWWKVKCSLVHIITDLRRKVAVKQAAARLTVRNVSFSPQYRFEDACVTTLLSVGPVNFEPSCKCSAFSSNECSSCVSFIAYNVSFIVGVALCAAFCLSVVCYFVWYVYFCVLCLTVVPLPPGKNTICSSIK
jgi:hypothetical protein